MQHIKRNIPGSGNTILAGYTVIGAGKPMNGRYYTLSVLHKYINKKDKWVAVVFDEVIKINGHKTVI